MKADIYIDKTEGGGVEISVVKHGLSSGAANKYNAIEKARAVLVTSAATLAFTARVGPSENVPSQATRIL